MYFSYFNNIGCAKGTRAVHEFVLRNVLREQTLIHVKTTEVVFGIAKFAPTVFSRISKIAESICGLRVYFS